MSMLVRLATFVMALVVTTTSLAEAQYVDSGVFRGVFGGAQPLQSRGHVLDLTGSISGSYMADVSDLPGAPENSTASGDSMMGGTSASLTYLRNWKSASIGGMASGGLSYVKEYEETGSDPWVNRWQAGMFAGGTMKLARRTNLTLQGATFYTPYYGLGGAIVGGGTQWGSGSSGASGFPGMVPGSGSNLGGPGVVPGLDHALADEPSLNTLGSARLEQSLTRFGSLEGYYAGRFTTFFGSDDVQSDQLDHMVGGRYRYYFKQFLSARAGYAYRRTQTNSELPIENHDIDVGVDSGYNREFALTRKTSLTFGVNSGVYLLENVSTDQDFTPDPRLFVGGRAALAHRWGRTWQARVEYIRSADYVPGFTQPFFGNNATASVDGFFSRKIDFRASGWYSRGDVGQETEGSGYTILSVYATARGAISRRLAWYSQYFLYRTDFGSDVDRPFGIQPSIDRHGVTVGLTLWMPLIGRR